MGQFLLLLIAALVIGAVVFGVAVLVSGDDPGIEGHEPDGRAVPLPSTRPLTEGDVSVLRFDTALRGYRMDQVDSAFRRVAYDIGYKAELIQVLEAEVKALRDGREDDAEVFRRAREAAMGTGAGSAVGLPTLREDLGVDDAPGSAGEVAESEAAVPEPATPDAASGERSQVST
jgi:DivIVA domain-containing protein